MEAAARVEGAVSLAGRTEGRQCDAEEFGHLFAAVKDGSPLYVPQTLRGYGAVKPLAYGELSVSLVSQVLWQVRCGQQADELLVDIGSGVGNVCVQAAVQLQCAAVGVEVRPELHDVARDLVAALQRETSDRLIKCAPVTLIRADVRDCPAVQEVLRKATIVIVNNVVFPADLDMAIFALLKRELRPGARVVCFKDCFPRLRGAQHVPLEHPLGAFRLPPLQLCSDDSAVSWTASAIRYLVFVVRPPPPRLTFPLVRGQLTLPQHATIEQRELFLVEQRLLDEWREATEALTREGVQPELLEMEQQHRQPQQVAAPPPAVVSKKGREKIVHRAAESDENSRDSKREDSKKKPEKRQRGKRWEYVEEIPFILPPSPPRARSRAFKDSIQTRGLSTKRQKAIIRQRPRSPSPMRTRGARKKIGKEVVDLKKLVIWNEEPDRDHDDFCAVCFGDGLLLCCESMCWRSFHVACVGLEEPPEGKWVCELCSRSSHEEPQCCICGIDGFTNLVCTGGCGNVCHEDCAGYRDRGANAAWTCAECGANGECIEMQIDVEEQEIVQQVYLAEEGEEREQQEEKQEEKLEEQQEEQPKDANVDVVVMEVEGNSNSNRNDNYMGEGKLAFEERQLLIEVPETGLESQRSE